MTPFCKNCFVTFEVPRKSYSFLRFINNSDSEFAMPSAAKVLEPFSRSPCFNNIFCKMSCLFYNLFLHICLLFLENFLVAVQTVVVIVVHEELV